jgi:multidrug transporter EmrE-like cation transporter
LARRRAVNPEIGGSMPSASAIFCKGYRVSFLVNLSLLFGGILLTCGDLMMKAWSVSNKRSSYILGVIFWALASLFIAWTYKHKNMVVITVLYILVNVGALMIINSIHYHESLNIKQYIGIVFGLVATSLLL